MQWRIDGADPATGADRTLIVEADNGLEAESQAGGMLVSSCRKATADDIYEFMPSRTLDYDTGIPTAAPKPRIPQYKEIQSGSSILSALSMICFIIGTFQFIATAVLMFIAIDGGRAGTDVAIYGIPLAIGCFLWLVVGCMLSMLASLALAIRDMARNSFGSK